MPDVLFISLIVILVTISAFCSGIAGGLLSLNHYQLKRKAQVGDHKAKAVYPLHSLGYQLIVTLLLINIVANSTIAVLLYSRTGGLIAVILSTACILFFGEILPMIYLRKHVIAIVSALSPIIKKVHTAMVPLTKPIGNLLDKYIGKDGQLFYSKEELLKMFDANKLAKESDVATDELRMIKSMLEFGDKKVRDVMTPRRMVVSVGRDDEIGPILMNELHASGHSRFPVSSQSKNNIFVGTLYLHDLVNEKNAKKVRDVMKSTVLYLHEEESLDHALRAFLKTRHHLFVVVNSFEEFVGVLSLEDVLEEIIGHEIVDEFDTLEDLRVTANSLAEKERILREKNTTKPKEK
jgi:CBS domain containing-hemolysin-like protein